MEITDLPKTGKINDYFEDLTKDDVEFQEYTKKWGALSNFILDFEHLKGIKNLTQKDIAQKMGTTQSAISRVVRMKGKPSYDILRKMSLAVGGELFITPMSEQSLTLPYDLHEKVNTIAKLNNETANEFLLGLIRKELDNTTLWGGINSTFNNNDDLQHPCSKYSSTSSEESEKIPFSANHGSGLVACRATT